MFFLALPLAEAAQIETTRSVSFLTYGISLAICGAIIAAAITLLYKLKQEKELLETEAEKKDAALRERPMIMRQDYHIATIGFTGCGKTALTWKWANPFIDIEKLPPNVGKQKYETVVSSKDDMQGTFYQHTYVIHDYPGENKTQCREDMQKLDIRALLIVVDVAKNDSNKSTFSQPHIDDQVSKWNAAALEFLFGEEIQKHCKKYIFFINKSDILQESYPESDDAIDKRAQILYKPVIDSLKELGRRFGAVVTILTGSAKTGRGCPALYKELLTDILPVSALSESLQYVPTAGLTTDQTGIRVLSST
jgi:hypothetical protein